MIQNMKKARPDVGASKRAGLEAETWQATASITKDTTAPSSGQALKISSLLSHGAENGVTLHHLEKLTDLPGREVRRQIERERRAGALIVSDNQHGYFLADDPAEAQRFARSMQHRAREILRTARAIEEAAGLD